jgi:hypothetical protein
MRLLISFVCIAVLCGCASIQRSQLAQDAKQRLVGMRDEQVLACMGPPHNRSAIGATEVWQYQSGNGHVDVNRVASVSGSYGMATGSSSAVASQRLCTINIAMTNQQVQSVTYLGPTGGLMTAGEQCAFALQGCVGKQ